MANAEKTIVRLYVEGPSGLYDPGDEIELAGIGVDGEFFGAMAREVFNDSAMAGGTDKFSKLSELQQRYGTHFNLDKLRAIVGNCWERAVERRVAWLMDRIDIEDKYVTVDSIRRLSHIGRAAVPAFVDFIRGHTDLSLRLEHQLLMSLPANSEFRIRTMMGLLAIAPDLPYSDAIRDEAESILVSSGVYAIPMLMDVCEFRDDPKSVTYPEVGFRVARSIEVLEKILPKADPANPAVRAAVLSLISFLSPSDKSDKTARCHGIIEGNAADILISMGRGALTFLADELRRTDDVGKKLEIVYIISNHSRAYRGGIASIS